MGIVDVLPVDHSVPCPERAFFKAAVGEDIFGKGKRLQTFDSVVFEIPALFELKRFFIKEFRILKVAEVVRKNDAGAMYELLEGEEDL